MSLIMARLSDIFGWKQGSYKKFRQAKAFYFVIAASTTIGHWINFSNIAPVKVLVYAANAQSSSNTANVNYVIHIISNGYLLTDTE